MPEALTPRQEAFCQAMAIGGSAAAAARAAGYGASGSRTQGWRLLQRRAIRWRIHDLQAQGRDLRGALAAKFYDEAEAVQRAAIEDDNHSLALRALGMKLRIVREHGAPAHALLFGEATLGDLELDCFAHEAIRDVEAHPDTPAETEPAADAAMAATVADAARDATANTSAADAKAADPSAETAAPDTAGEPDPAAPAPEAGPGDGGEPRRAHGDAVATRTPSAVQGLAMTRLHRAAHPDLPSTEGGSARGRDEDLGQVASSWGRLPAGLMGDASASAGDADTTGREQASTTVNVGPADPSENRDTATLTPFTPRPRGVNGACPSRQAV